MTHRQDGIGVYLHIPFCERQCHFCAFFTRGYREGQAAAYVTDLLAEIRLIGQAGWLRGRPLETIYVGGGTPTLLSADQLLAILDCCRHTWNVESTAEITIEANPATVDERTLRTLRRGGVNRISFGAQSFDDVELKALGAPHTVKEIRHAIWTAREAGFTNLNLDLIYGLPGQSTAHWLANVEAAIGLGPDHLSLYGLSIEEGTRFQREVERERLALPAEDILADMYRMGRETVGASGYVQYEVSNFCRPGYACRHNLGYWTDREWVGLGPSAHSYLDGDRFSNIESLDEYHRLVLENIVPIGERDPGTPDLRLREALALGLRMVGGVRLGPLGDRYGHASLERFRQTIAQLFGEGWLILNGDLLQPSAAGILFADDLALAFL